MDLPWIRMAVYFVKCNWSHGKGGLILKFATVIIAILSFTVSIKSMVFPMNTVTVPHGQRGEDHKS